MRFTPGTPESPSRLARIPRKTKPKLGPAVQIQHKFEIPKKLSRKLGRRTTAMKICCGYAKPRN
eukprot:scaffold354393_cov43-Prasinocladus_malaysianus.AAC.1